MAFTPKSYHEYTIEDDDEFRRQHEDEIENRREGLRGNLYVEFIHVSCRSSQFRANRNYLGFILYEYDGKTEWRLNGRKCKSGYLCIVDEDTVNEVGIAGTAHAKAYYHIFGEVPNRDKLVASGFAYQQRQWKQTSGTFNSIWNSYTVDNPRTGVTEMDHIVDAINNWKNGGCQNHRVNMVIKRKR
ncbi:uncharacterized protein LOC142349238 isoform X2 [Convolutriloba macropyga]|uniref:uncharacterized protein LOC142349238 isoform X2 n=1 Tax=Convolutriloba macropyga TaxID=536237 RepID=UPI003F51C11A